MSILLFPIHWFWEIALRWEAKLKKNVACSIQPLHLKLYPHPHALTMYLKRQPFCRTMSMIFCNNCTKRSVQFRENIRWLLRIKSIRNYASSCCQIKQNPHGLWEIASRWFSNYLFHETSKSKYRQYLFQFLFIPIVKVPLHWLSPTKNIPNWLNAPFPTPFYIYVWSV